MIPGPVQVIACPHCGALATHGTMMSGNTVGEEIWTDGMRFAPMLLFAPAVAECEKCKKPFWLQDARTVGEFSDGPDAASDVDPSWVEAPSVREPSAMGYYVALKSGFARSPTQEKSLRRMAMWRENDSVRGPAPQTRQLSTEATANMTALARLLDESDTSECIMKAEIFRELGEFDLAMQLLARVDDPDYAWVVEVIRSLCEQRDAMVRELQPGF